MDYISMLNSPPLEGLVLKFSLKKVSTLALHFSMKPLLIKFTISELQRSLNQAYHLRPDTQ